MTEDRLTKNAEMVRMLLALGVKCPQRLLGQKEEAQKKTAVQQDANEEKWLEEISAFIRCCDFMKLGQSISHGQWQTASMLIRRMHTRAKLLGTECFSLQFSGLKQAIAKKDAQDAKQILTAVTAKRVKILDVLNRYGR